MNALPFPWNAYLGALLGAFAVTAASAPLWIRFCRRRGLIDDPGPRKIHAAPIPLAGGLAVAAGLLLPLLAGAVSLKLGVWPETLAGPIERGLHRRAPQLAAICLGALGMLALGLIDDFKELRPRLKFAGQFSIAAIVALSGVRITLFVDNEAFAFAATVLWILTVTNALNFLDNMNGLCAGLGWIGAFFFGLSAAVLGQYLVASFCFLVAGACLGFLPFNFPKAKTFLGDAGSHLIGYLLAIIAILPHFYTEQSAAETSVWDVLDPLIILAVPFLDLVWVVCLRWRSGQPFYLGDTNHISHRLTRRGWRPSTAVLWIWLAATLAGAMSLL